MAKLHRGRSLVGMLALYFASSALAPAQCDGAFHGRTACHGAFSPVWWTTSFVGTAGSTATAIADSGCGSPAPGVSVTCAVNASSGYAIAGVAMLRTAATWTPDSAATTVSMRIDNVVVNSSGSGQAVRPLLKQGGNTYLGPVVATGLPATWTTITIPHVPEAGFEKLIGPALTTDPNSHPVFASGGAVITFGFLVANSGASSYSRTHCYDNWEVVLDDPASFTSYGTGCGVDCSDSFVEYFPPGSFDLSNRATYTMTPIGSGYIVSVPGGNAFLPPSAAAAVLPLGDDDEVLVAPSSPFPTPCDGLVNAFVVCSNGFVSLGSNGTNYVPDVAQMLSAPHSGWWSWHDFDPSQPGSGSVKYEEVGGVVYFTWDNVWDWGSMTGSTVQFQFDLTNGNVTYACLGVSQLGSAHVVGYSRGGAPLGACVTDLSALVSITPFQLCCNPMGTSLLQLTMLDQPVIGTTPRFLTSNIPPRTLFTFVAFGITQFAYDLTPFMPGCFLLQDMALPFGPIVPSPGPTATTTYGLLNPVPNLLGARAYAQAVAWVGGLQTGITSNGIEMVLGY